MNLSYTMRYNDLLSRTSKTEKAYLQRKQQNTTATAREEDNAYILCRTSRTKKEYWQRKQQNATARAREENNTIVLCRTSKTKKILAKKTAKCKSKGKGKAREEENASVGTAFTSGSDSTIGSGKMM